jgi:hypothetical protein
MNLKPLVNDKTLWSDFLEELDQRVDAVHKKMSQMDEPKDLYRCQGELKALRSLQKLRDKVNNG